MYVLILFDLYDEKYIGKCNVYRIMTRKKNVF